MALRRDSRGRFAGGGGRGRSGKGGLKGRYNAGGPRFKTAAMRGGPRRGDGRKGSAARALRPLSSRTGLQLGGNRASSAKLSREVLRLHRSGRTMPADVVSSAMRDLARPRRTRKTFTQRTR